LNGRRELLPLMIKSTIVMIMMGVTMEMTTMTVMIIMLMEIMKVKMMFFVQQQIMKNQMRWEMKHIAVNVIFHLQL